MECVVPLFGLQVLALLSSFLFWVGDESLRTFVFQGRWAFTGGLH